MGVVLQGGGDELVIDGLNQGLKELGLVEGKDYSLEVRNLKGDTPGIATAAKGLERDGADVIYSVATSVTAVVKRSTAKVPIVFAVGSDPAAAGLVASFAKPGGRLTGVHYSTNETTPKRLEILKAILPNLRSVVTFYDPGNPSAVGGAKMVRDAARQLKIEVIERHVTSVQELRTAVTAFKSREADAYFYTNDAMVRSQAQFIVDTMKAKKVPTMFSWPGFVAQGALAGYGVSFREVGRVSARYVQRILAGSNPADLPVENISRVELAVNLKTARDIGIAIPQAVRLSAAEVDE